MSKYEQLLEALTRLEKSQEVTSKQIQELKESQKETDEQMKETAQQMKKTDEQFKETAQQIKKTDEQLKETAQQMKETDRKLKKLGQLTGNIANNQGDVAENFFYNSFGKNPKLGGIEYDFIYKNSTKRRQDIEDEYDILLINGNDVAIIEVKYKANQNDLKKLLTKKYENFKKLFPEYIDYNHHLGLASFHLNDDLKKEALENSVIILERKGDIVETSMP